MLRKVHVCVLSFCCLLFCTSVPLFAWDDEEPPKDPALRRSAEETIARLVAVARKMGLKPDAEPDKWGEDSMLSFDFKGAPGVRGCWIIRAWEPGRLFHKTHEWAHSYKLKREEYCERRKGEPVIERDGVVLAYDKKRACNEYGVLIRSKAKIAGAREPTFSRSASYWNLEGYASKRGWAYISGSYTGEICPAHIMVLQEADPDAGIELVEQERKLTGTVHEEINVYASVGNLLIQGSFAIYQRCDPDEEIGSEAEDGYSTYVSPAVLLADPTGDRVPGFVEMRKFVDFLLARAKRDDNAITDRLECAFHSSKNIVIFGKGTEQMRALAIKLQGLYDQYDEISPYPDSATAKSINDRFIDFASKLDAAVAGLNGGNGELSISLEGIPGNGDEGKLSLARLAFQHWHDEGRALTRLATTINDKLLKQQNTFSANIVKSVFKNYLDWADAVPGGPGDVLSLMGGAAGSIPWDLPGNLSDWYDTMQGDAEILKNQALTVARLRELREFYLSRAERVVDEMTKLKSAVAALEQLREMDRSTSDRVAVFANLEVIPPL